MANYLLVYKGGGEPASEAEGQAVMQAWMGWFGGLGEAVVDGGKPCGASKSIATNGNVGGSVSGGATGYSVLKADSLDAATEMAKGCPHLKSGGSIEVYETVDVM